MNTKSLATILCWIARVVGTLLVGLTLCIAMGEGMPNVFTLPFIIQIGFFALTLVLLGILLAWRWELLGGIMSLVGWVLFVAAENISYRHALFFILLAVPSLLFMGSSFFRRHHERHQPS